MIAGTAAHPTFSILAKATTRADAGYSLEDLEPGTYTVYASSADSLERAVTTSVVVTAGADVTAPDLHLTPTGSISGEATLDGAATGNLGIVVFIAGTSYAALTDDGGNYTISGVPTGHDR